jgi:hypothetical protein
MPSTEGSYGVVYGNGPFGWDAEGLAAADLAAGVLNALESYFWVRTPACWSSAADKKLNLALPL